LIFFASVRIRPLAILRGCCWPCQPRIPAGRPPCPTAPLCLPAATSLLLAHHHRPLPPPSHCLTASRCLRRQLSTLPDLR
jgi:hypothetical protein